jgi:MFS family permease
MPGNYRAAFRTPGSAAFSTACFVMRLPIAMYPIGLILLVSTHTHHYGFAGVLGGAYIVGNAIGNPPAARLVDRYGQARMLAPMTAAHVLAVAALVLLSHGGAPDWTLLLPALVMGVCYLPVGSLVRARWSFVLDGRPELATAYSVESTLDEVIYIVGPLVASVLATQINPLWTMILGAVLVSTGTVLLLRLKATQPPAHPVGEPQRPSALREHGLIAIVIISMAMGALFASAEVAIVAFCGQHGEQSLTGVVLAALALGSAVSGIWYGGRAWQRSLLDRYRVHAVLFGLLPWLFLAAVNVGLLAACAFVVGLFVAPTLITLFGLVSEVVAGSALTEGIAWALTGLNIGYGVAAALTGRVSDSWGTRAAFGVTIGSATVLALLSLQFHASMRKWRSAPIPR